VQYTQNTRGKYTQIAPESKNRYKSHCGRNLATSQNEMYPETVSILSKMPWCQRIVSSFKDHLKYNKVVINSAIECKYYRDADKSLARPGRKEATATEDFLFHISSL
jgi:hypothetical protein